MVKSDLQPDKFGMAAQQLDADGVEGADPGHALDGRADQHADALLHLARGLVGEGDGEDLARECTAGRQDMGDAGGEHAGLAGAGAGQHQHRAFQRFDGFPLLRIQAGEITRGCALTRGHGAGGDAGRRASGPRGRATRRRLLVEEGNIVRKALHNRHECNDSGRKGQKRPTYPKICSGKWPFQPRNARCDLALCQYPAELPLPPRRGSDQNERPLSGDRAINNH